MHEILGNKEKISVELNNLVVILKEQECYCYRIAHFLLGKEEAAEMATEQALLELARNRCFFAESAEQRRESAKKVIIKHSLKASLNQ
jgi:hypothetical protein